MKKTGLLKRAASGAAAMMMAFGLIGTMGVSAADAHTYESLGVDGEAKAEFEAETSANTSLPVINVTTNNNSELILSKEVYTDCVVDVFNAGEEYELDQVSAGIRVRGNSSAYYGDVEQIKRNPVPYRIKFDKKQNMLGLNDGAKCKSWVLLKSDWDLIRNDIALRMGRSIFGDTAYVSDSQFVHLYVNDRFQGIYVLCEQNQVNENRVNITEPEEGYTGTDIGYYLELNNYATRINPDGSRYDDDPYITMDYEEATVTDVRGTKRQFVPAEYSIKNDVYSDEQIAFIDKYLNNSFELLYKAVEQGEYLTFDENFDLIESDYTSAEECIGAVMDLDSIVDMYLLYEIVHDYDCGEGSFYMCVDFAEGSNTPKLQFTSPWDFNWAYNDSTERYWAGAFCTSSFARQSGDRSNPWFILLAKEDWFHDLCVEKWTDANSCVKAAIQEERDILAAYPEDLTKTSESAIDDANTLLDWIDRRMVWMDKTFLASEEDDSSIIEESSTVEESSVTESDTEESTPESSSSSSSSQAESSKAAADSSSKAAATGTTTNPATGAAATGVAICTIAAAGMVVAKRKKK